MTNGNKFKNNLKYNNNNNNKTMFHGMIINHKKIKFHKIITNGVKI
jgi:hypothetical protein